MDVTIRHFKAKVTENKEFASGHILRYLDLDNCTEGTLPEWCITSFVILPKELVDNQVSNVYILWLDREPEEFVLQTEEVSEVRWFDLEECMRLVEHSLIQSCIAMEELLMVERGIGLAQFE